MPAEYPFVNAKHQTDTGAKGRAIQLVVLHTMELPETVHTAENCAHYFATVDKAVSAHYCVDNDSTVQCVLDKNVAYAAPGANHNGIQIEMAGASAQNSRQWSDDYSVAVIHRAAALAREKCLEYGLPIRFVDAAGLRQGLSGITTHKIVNDAFHQSTHTDPGPWFPLGLFVDLANNGNPSSPHNPVEDDMPLNEADFMRIADSVHKVLGPQFDQVDGALADLAKRLTVLETHAQPAKAA